MTSTIACKFALKCLSTLLLAGLGCALALPRKVEMEAELEVAAQA